MSGARDSQGAGAGGAGEGKDAGRRVALVTGGARGIGLGCARALAAEGWDLAVCGTRPEADAAAALKDIRAAGAIGGLRAAGTGVLYVQADILEDGAADVILEAVRARFSRLDLLVNNAGVAPLQRLDIMDATRESFDRVIGINLRGPYFLTQAAARWMREQRTMDPGRRCAVVFITSISATVASVNRGDYCISKAGLSMAARLWAVRLAEYDIPVWEVQPGIVRTDMTEKVSAKYDEMIAQGAMLQRRWGMPEDVGKTVAALARGDIPYSSGQKIIVDGGLTVPRM